MSEDLKNLDTLESKLNKPKGFDPNFGPHVLKEKKNEKDIKYSWGKEGSIITPIHIEKNTVSFGVKLFFVSVVFLVASLSYTAYRITSDRNTVSSTNIDVILSLKPYVEGGEVVPFTIDVQNRNLLPLKSSALTITYKKGFSSQNESEEIHERIEIGDIQKNESRRGEKNIQLFGSEAESKDVIVKLEYKVAGSAAVFSKVVSASTIIKTPSVSVHLDGPGNLSSGQTGTYVVNVKNNTSTTTTPFIVSLSLPPSFIVDSADPKLTTKDMFWNIDKLKIGESKQISVTGSFSTNNSTEKITIHTVAGVSSSNSKNITTVYSSDLKDVVISTSPIKLTLATSDGSSSGYLKYGDRAAFVLSYKNTSNRVLRNVEIDVNISGTAPIINSILDDGYGYYDSIKQTIMWNKATLPALDSLEPGADGSIRFYIPIVSKGVNLPNLKVAVTSFADLASTRDVTASVSGSWVVKGTLSVNALTSYKKSSFLNSGPVPPKANTETTYTAKIFASSQNNLEEGRVSFVLPIYTTWKGVFTEGKNIVYDDKTRTVVWDIGDIKSGETVNTEIQLSVRPSQSHVGQAPSITGGIVFEGVEIESNSLIKTSVSPLNTNIFGEEWNLNTGTVLDR